VSKSKQKLGVVWVGGGAVGGVSFLFYFYFLFSTLHSEGRSVFGRTVGLRPWFELEGVVRGFSPSLGGFLKFCLCMFGLFVYSETGIVVVAMYTRGYYENCGNTKICENCERCENCETRKICENCENLKPVVMVEIPCLSLVCLMILRGDCENCNLRNL
jgi:hypothetical protein